MMSSHTRSPEKSAIYEKQVQILYQHVPAAIMLAFGSVVAYAGIVWNLVPSLRIIIWVLCNLLAFLGRFYLCWRYKQQKQPIQNPELWFLGVAGLTCLSGALWGSTAFFLLPDALPYHFLLVGFLGAFTAGAVGIYSIMPEIVAGFTLLALFPMFIRFSLFGDPIYLGVIVIIPIYWVGMQIMSRQIHRSMITSFKLNAELEESRNMLESRVAQRTEALSEANTQLRKLTNAIEQSVEMVVITDLDGKIEFVNPIVEKKTGYEASSLQGKTLQAIQKNKNNTALFDEIFQTVRAGNTWHGEIVNETKSGVCYITEMTMNAVYDDESEMTHFVSIIRDLTEKRELERELLQASKLSSLGTLVSGIAHELNTPLATILGYSREIRQEADLKPDIKKCANWIVQESERCAIIVRNLLEFSRKGEATNSVFSLNNLLEKVLDIYRHPFKTDSIRLKSDLQPTPLFIYGDPDKLQQVIVNILQNARQSIQKLKSKGIIKIKTNLRGQSGKGHQNTENEVQIEIENDGPPIPSADFEKIFDPFYTTKAMGDGTGLGLSLSYGIIKAHQGRIWVENTRGPGVRFYIVLPLVEPILQQDQAPIEEISMDCSLPEGLKILVVEDDEKFRMWLGRFLSREGALVTEAANGQEAIDRLDADKADVILSDFKMPEMDGLELCRWIEKERPEYMGRFCFLTGITETTLNDFCKERNIPILMKPIEKKQFLEALAQVHG